jgi:hypothetical protein
MLYGVHVNTAIGGVILVSGCVSLAYGLLDIFAPSLTTRWQVRSTAKHGGSRQSVGMGFQRALGIDPDADPWNDGAVKRRVRWIGLGVSVFGLAAVALGMWMVASD